MENISFYEADLFGSKLSYMVQNGESRPWNSASFIVNGPMIYPVGGAAISPDGSTRESVSATPWSGWANQLMENVPENPLVIRHTSLWGQLDGHEKIYYTEDDSYTSFFVLDLDTSYYYYYSKRDNKVYLDGTFSLEGDKNKPKSITNNAWFFNIEFQWESNKSGTFVWNRPSPKNKEANKFVILTREEFIEIYWDQGN
tara:strand:+ start:25 stop:621 length:597 start_codon:yes stop_codon:yes gene_type:complete